MNQHQEAPVEPPVPTPAGKVMDHVIPTRNQPALLGYYCSIFGLIPIAGLFLAPAAIAYGLIGMERGNRLHRNIGYGHALFATVAGTIGAIINYGLAVALAVVLIYSYLTASWPFLPEHPVPVILEDHQRQLDDLQKQVDQMQKQRAVPGRNVH